MQRFTCARPLRLAKQGGRGVLCLREAEAASAEERNPFRRRLKAVPARHVERFGFTWPAGVRFGTPAWSFILIFGLSS